MPPIVFGSTALGNAFQVVPDVTKLEMCSKWFDHVAPPVFIDTAGKYGAGLALEVIGRSLAKFEIPPRRWLSAISSGGSAPLRTSEPIFEPGVWIDIEHDAVQRISYDGILECWDEGCRLLGPHIDLGLRRSTIPTNISPPPARLTIAAAASTTFSTPIALAELKLRGDVAAVGVGAKDWHAVRKSLPPSRSIGSCSRIASRSCVIRRTWWHSCGVWLTRRRDHQFGRFHAGFLVGGRYFDYRVVGPENDADQALFAWRKSFVALCEAHGISPLHACVQFGFSAVRVSLPWRLNTSHADRVGKNVAAVLTPVPQQFWATFRKKA